MVSTSRHFPERIRAIYSNIKLLRKSAEDAKKDAQLWASRSEGDVGAEFEGIEDTDLPSGASCRPGETKMLLAFHDVLTDMYKRDAVTQGSTQLRCCWESSKPQAFRIPALWPTKNADTGSGRRQN